MKLTEYQVEKIYKHMIKHCSYIHIDNKYNIIIRHNLFGSYRIIVLMPTNQWRAPEDKEIGIMNETYKISNGMGV